MSCPQSRPCPACGGELEPWLTAPPAEAGIEGPIALRRCRSCGTAITDGAPRAADLYESGAYASQRPLLSDAALPVLRAFDGQRLRLLGRALDRGPRDRPLTLLDVGAGRGRFVSSATRAGFLAGGIEPSARGVAAARQAGIELRPQRIDEATVPAASLDAITAWHVLEHVDDPAAAVARMRGWLAPGGILLVGVPNLASLQARLGGARWYHLDLPRHRTHFTPAGLRALVARQGLAPLHVHHLLVEHNPFGMWQSLVNRATDSPSYLYNLLKRNAPVRRRDLFVTAAAMPLAPLAAALELLAGAARRGGTIALTARRP